MVASSLTLGAMCAVASSDSDAVVHVPTTFVFPRTLVDVGLDKGTVKVAVHVSAEGQLIDALVVEAQYRDLIEAVMRSVPHWRYTPPTRNGRAVSFQKEIVIELSAGSMVTTVSAVDHLYASRAPTRTKPIYRSYSLKELDQIPPPIEMNPPVYPMDLQEAGIVGKVVVEFYIDETGRVRLPFIKESAAPELSLIALEAVHSWKFAPPLYHDEPVLVKAVQTFVFKPSQRSTDTK